MRIAPTPESVHQQIREARARWLMAGEDPPDILYLGRMENASVDTYAERYLTSLEKMVTNRRTYEGMEIVRVDLVMFIGFGIKTLCV